MLTHHKCGQIAFRLQEITPFFSKFSGGACPPQTSLVKAQWRSRQAALLLGGASALFSNATEKKLLDTPARADYRKLHGYRAYNYAQTTIAVVTYSACQSHRNMYHSTIER